MPDRVEFDIIIFGASGYTGKCVLVDFVRMNENKYRWAVAGRNVDKLKAVLQWLSVKTGKDVSHVNVIKADCSSKESINNMTKKGRILINCCGPYRLYGEVVVRACVENGTHHVDVSGEPEYMEKMQLQYHQKAEENECYIVSACGFDSLPADFGVIYLTQNFPGTVNSIESYMVTDSKFSGTVANSGTWKSAVLALSSRETLMEMRKKYLQQANRPKLKPLLKYRPVIHKSELFDNRFAVPFPGSDKSVVFRTQTFFHNYYNQRPIQYHPYYVCSSFIGLIGLTIIGLMLIIFSKFNLGRKLLIQYPKVFSLGLMSDEGPTEENRAATLVRFRFKGNGWTSDVVEQFTNKNEIALPTNKSIITEVSVEDFGYGFTAKAIILSAFTILSESDKMPSKGGVYPPGAAFLKTSFLEKLQQQGATFKVLTEP